MNKRSLILGSAALLVLTLLSASIVSATPGKVASFSAKVTPGHPGGSIQVQAKVLHPVRGTTFAATAVAHFTSGITLPVPLKRSGNSYVAVGKIPVPAGQAAGDVTVDVTIVYGGATTVINRTSQIKAP